MSQSLLKVSSQGVRDFTLKPQENINDDIGDVYNEQPDAKLTPLGVRKPSVSSNGTTKRKKLGRKNGAIKTGNGFGTMTKKDLILKSRKTFFIFSSLALF